jgi:hypothetical protein
MRDKNYNNFAGGENNWSSRDLVLWSSVHGQQGIPDLAQAQQEGTVASLSQSIQPSCRIQSFSFLWHMKETVSR